MIPGIVGCFIKLHDKKYSLPVWHPSSLAARQVVPAPHHAPGQARQVLVASGAQGTDLRHLGVKAAQGKA